MNASDGNQANYSCVARSNNAEGSLLFDEQIRIETERRLQDFIQTKDDKKQETKDDVGKIGDIGGRTINNETRPDTTYLHLSTQQAQATTTSSQPPPFLGGSQLEPNENQQQLLALAQLLSPVNPNLAEVSIAMAKVLAMSNNAARPSPPMATAAHEIFPLNGNSNGNHQHHIAAPPPTLATTAYEILPLNTNNGNNQYTSTTAAATTHHQDNTTFPQLLMDVIEEETKNGVKLDDGRNVLEWTSKGDGFYIRSKSEFEDKVLPRYFMVKCKFRSFARKLYRYIFFSFVYVCNSSSISISYIHIYFVCANLILHLDEI